MSLISTQVAYSQSTMALSNIQFDIKLVQNEMMMLTQQVQYAMGDEQMMQQLRVRNVQLEQELKMLEAEYEAIKIKLEGEEKMRKEAIQRGFKLNI